MTEAEEQAEIIRFLADPDTYGVGSVDRIDTHVNHVFLAGDRVYKMKRAVRFPFLDFSTLAARKAACEAEVALNRRTAPALYEGVVAVTRRTGGRLVFDGDGEPVEWVVVMRRFDQDTLFDRLAGRGGLDEPLMRGLADRIAAFHQEAERRPDQGGDKGVRFVVESNMETLEGPAAGPLDEEKVARLGSTWRDSLDRLAPLLERRRESGFVRRCHGDLHLRNICLIDGRPTLFDCIEFSERIACIDVFYDLAFLLMDLEHRNLRALAGTVLNRYLAMTADFEALAALPLFLSLRAGVRAMISAMEGEEQSDDALCGEARAYLDAALFYLEPRQTRLVAVGGLSGTGKSTVAAALAPHMGARPAAAVLRSDVIRKRHFGRAPEDALPKDAYTQEASAAIYEQLMGYAAAAIAAGHDVIVDAVFARPGEREAIAAVAAAADVPFLGLWLEASEETLVARVGARRNDASDADASVVRRQQEYDLGTLDWRRIDTGGSLPATVAAAKAAIDSD